MRTYGVAVFDNALSVVLVKEEAKVQKVLYENSITWSRTELIHC